MKIMAIVGSSRRGNTYSMVEAATHALSNPDIEFIHLKDFSINFCDGCLTCDESGKCHINDEMSDLLERIKEADGFIFGTPSRWSLLSGELKVFLDRLNPLAVPELLKGKKAIIFATGQSKNEDIESIELAANSIKSFCENAEIEVIDIVLAEDCLEPEDLISKYPQTLEKCKNSALKLYNSLNNG